MLINRIRFLLACISIFTIFPAYSADTNLTSQQVAEKMSKVDFSTWKSYSDNVKTCTPGTFQLPNPFAVPAVMTQPNISEQQLNQIIQNSMMTYQITGMKGDTCEVMITVVANQSNPNNKLGCAFPKNQLDKIASDASSVASDPQAASRAIGTDLSQYCKLSG